MVDCRWRIIKGPRLCLSFWVLRQGMGSRKSYRRHPGYLAIEINRQQDNMLRVFGGKHQFPNYRHLVGMVNCHRRDQTLSCPSRRLITYEHIQLHCSVPSTPSIRLCSVRLRPHRRVSREVKVRAWIRRCPLSVSLAAMLVECGTGYYLGQLIRGPPTAKFAICSLQSCTPTPHTVLQRRIAGL